MCADLCNLEADVRELEVAGIDILHFDLMDAHFVPNMPIGLALIEQLRPKTDAAFDIHLMVENNDFFVDAVAEIGVQQVAVHVESATHLDRTLSLIQAHGIKAGAALNPATPLSALDYVLDRFANRDSRSRGIGHTYPVHMLHRYRTKATGIQRQDHPGQNRQHPGRKHQRYQRIRVHKPLGSYKCL